MSNVCEFSLFALSVLVFFISILGQRAAVTDRFFVGSVSDSDLGH